MVYKFLKSADNIKVSQNEVQFLKIMCAKPKPQTSTCISFFKGLNA